MRRRITGFHQDDAGDWVVELECHHTQHVRHNPPFAQRPWVLTDASRRERIGTALPCPPCARGESRDVDETVGEPAAPAAALRPDSVAWQVVGDRRGLLTAGYALLMQVAHPAIGAGVADHSTFAADPWGRLERTTTSLMRLVYGGADAHGEARRLREVHRRIAGVDAVGHPYRALDPEPYWWTHAALYEAIVASRRWFARPLTADEEHRLYAEWCALAALLGIPAGAVPGSLAAHRSVVDDMVRHRLQDNRTVRDVLHSLTLGGVPAPPWWRERHLPVAAWAPVRPVGRLVLERVTVGLTPPVLRDRLGLAWTATDAAALLAYATTVRTAAPFLSDRLLYYPLANRARQSAAAAGGRRRAAAAGGRRRAAGG